MCIVFVLFAIFCCYGNLTNLKLTVLGSYLFFIIRDKKTRDTPK